MYKEGGSIKGRVCRGKDSTSNYMTQAFESWSSENLVTTLSTKIRLIEKKYLQQEIEDENTDEHEIKLI